MTRVIKSLSEIASDYDAIVLDQWGVLHDGSAAYPGTAAALKHLMARGTRLAVLSNSGKRAAPNRARIAAMGFSSGLFDCVMTSGEALWRDIANGTIPERHFFPVERTKGDARAWASDLAIDLTPDLNSAEAVLLMGLPDGTNLSDWQPLLEEAASRHLRIYCSNPDKASPRAGGQTVLSPGALADIYTAAGGDAVYYGKPYKPVFDALEHALGTNRLLMVGDSLEHDIAGAVAAGWDSVLIQGGLYAADFSTGDADRTLARLSAEKNAPFPTYRLEVLR